MTNVKVQYAKTHLSALLTRVEAGEEITISRGDTEVAKLVAVQPRTTRDLGFLNLTLPDSFFDQLGDEELVAWEGR